MGLDKLESGLYTRHSGDWRKKALSLLTGKATVIKRAKNEEVHAEDTIRFPPAVQRFFWKTVTSGKTYFSGNPHKVIFCEG